MDLMPANRLKPQTNSTSPGAISLLPSPFPDDDVTGTEGFEGELLQELVSSGTQDQQHPSTPSPSSLPQLQPPQKFNPFFTLIEDTTTGEHHHPSVHYIFSDDDPDVVTDTLLHTLSPSPGSTSESGSNSTGNSKPHERYLLLDLSSTGNQIVSAKSLALDWQILDAQISAAPTFNGDAGPDGGDSAFLLKVEGMQLSNTRGETPAQEKLEAVKSRSGGDVLSALKSLEETFRREIGVLKRLDMEKEAPGGQGLG